jgi:hypothetical protein
MTKRQCRIVSGGELQTAWTPVSAIEPSGALMCETAKTVNSGRSAIENGGAFTGSATAADASHIDTALGMLGASFPSTPWHGTLCSTPAGANKATHACAADAPWHSSRSAAVNSATSDRVEREKRIWRSLRGGPYTLQIGHDRSLIWIINRRRVRACPMLPCALNLFGRPR